MRENADGFERGRHQLADTARQQRTPADFDVDEAVKTVTAVAVFVLFVGSFTAVMLGMTLFGRWRGWGDYFAPDIPRPPRSQWPWPCRLHLYHHWLSYRSEEGRYQRCSGCGCTRDVPAIPPI